MALATGFRALLTALIPYALKTMRRKEVPTPPFPDTEDTTACDKVPRGDRDAVRLIYGDGP